MYDTFSCESWNTVGAQPLRQLVVRVSSKPAAAGHHPGCRLPIEGHQSPKSGRQVRVGHLVTYLFYDFPFPVQKEEQEGKHKNVLTTAGH
jgi:hypothetical protein